MKQTLILCVLLLLFVFSKKGGEIRKNIDIRVAILEAKLKHYEIAEELGIHEFAFSRKLRYELTADEKQKILNVIEKLKQKSKSWR